MGSKLPNQREETEQPHPIVNEIAEMKQRLSRMESFIKQAAAIAAIEVRRVDEIKDSFEATVAALEAQLKEKEDILSQKDPGSQEQEGGLIAQILELESRLREKEELLAVRDAELQELRTKSESAITVVAAENRQVEEGRESLEAEVAALKAQLEEREKLLSQKDGALKEMEESLSGLEETLITQFRDLESRFEGMVQKSGSGNAAQGKRTRGSIRDPRDRAEKSPVTKVKGR